MKFRKYILYILSLLTLALAGCSFASGEAKNSLSIFKEPDKVTYHLGEKFTLDGIKVIDSFGMPVSDYSSSIKEGTILQTATPEMDVVISKKNYTSTSFKIAVFENHSLKVMNEPNKTTYYVGEAFSSEGLVVTDERYNPVDDYTLSLEEGYIFTASGTVTVEVTKPEYASNSFDLTIENAKALIVQHLPNKINYKVGDKFSSEGLVIGDSTGATDLPFITSIEEGSVLKYAGNIVVKVSVDGYEDTSFAIYVDDISGGTTTKKKAVDIYYLNDTHGSFSREYNNENAGMAYISSFLNENKANQENTIILSGGDMFQGGIESNNTRGKIMVDAMNIMEFDAMALGNHELDWGEDVLKETLKLANFPIISANTFRKDKISRPEWVTPYTIIERDDLKIGVIGFAREDMGSSITGSVAKEFYFPKPNDYIKKYASELRLSYNCDLILAVGHDEGYDVSYSNSPTDFKDITEINPDCGLKYVDGMFFAHDHNRKTGILNNVPYLEAGCNGKYIGHMVFDMRYNGVTYTSEWLDYGITDAYRWCQNEDTLITSLLTKYSDEIGNPDEVVATLKNSYSKKEFAKLVCHAMIWFVNNNKEEFDNVTVNFGTHNIGGIRTSYIYAGEITYKEIIEICPFDNPITIQKLYKSHVERYMSSSVNTYYQDGEIKYVNDKCDAVTISYIAEGSSSNQITYKEYPKYYARDALIAFLNSSEGSVY